METQSSRNAANLEFSVDLKAAARRHLAFLQLVENHSRLQDNDILRQAVYRYQHFWLPLVVRNKQRNLEAPLDVAWVWHCHMLSPEAYCKDTTRLFGEVVANTSLDRNEKTKRKLLQETEKLWQRAYPDDPFVVDLTASAQPGRRYVSGKTDFSYNIVSAALRQKEFGYQVSLPHYKDKKVLAKALLRYKKFIYLKSKRPEMFLVPCYDMDLVWHTHQLYPHLYKVDMERILGKLFNYDDSVNDRSEDSKLSSSDLATRQAWKEEYTENFAECGVMYRGPNPSGKLAAMTKDDILSISTHSANVVLKKIEVMPNFNLMGEPRLRVFKVTKKKETPLTRYLRGSEMRWQDKALFSCKFKPDSTIKFVLEETIKQTRCRREYSCVGEPALDMMQVFDSMPTGQTQTVQKSVLKNYVQVDFEAEVGPVTGGYMKFDLYTGEYESCVMPENNESIWGPVPMVKLPPGTDNRCEVATHRLLNHRGDIAFTCRLIHSLPLLQSVVQVFYKTSMVAVAHLIGFKTLPKPTQVASKGSCITKNTEAGERAVLIKNQQGDWGVVTGRWISFKRGVEGVAGNMHAIDVQGDPGTFTVKVRKLSEPKTRVFKLPYRSSRYNFSMLGLKVDLMTGSIVIDETCTEVAENVALAFSISLLHVLCQPKPRAWRPGQTTKPYLIIRELEKVTTIPSEEMAFVMAAGFLVSTPSNHYLQERYGANPHANPRASDIGIFEGEDGGAGCG